MKPSYAMPASSSMRRRRGEPLASSRRGWSGAAVTVELSHRDIRVLDRASAALAEQLASFPLVKDIDDGYTPGKQQLDYQLTAKGRSLGLTTEEVARQVRNAFYGAEAQRMQRGRNEVRAVDGAVGWTMPCEE